MKSLLFLAGLLATTLWSFGQGAISFANYVAGAVNAPVTNAAGNRIFGPPYVAHFFWSSNTQAAMDNLEPAGFDTQFSNFMGGGYFSGGGISLPVGEVSILAQVRVWDTNYGSGYYQARDNGGEFGFSNLIITYPSLPPGTPTWLSSLEGFQLQRLPHVTSLVTTTNTIILSWPIEQTAYAVQQNPDLLQSSWVTLPNQPVTVSQQQQVILPIPSNGGMFYRLVSQ